MYLRILCKFHVSDSCLSIFISQGPLQDPFFGFMSQHLRISGSSARSMCPIHVLAFMSQHPFISQDPLQDPCLRSFSIFVSQDSVQDPCLRIHVSASTNMDPLQDPRLWAHISASLYLRLLCKIHVSGSVYKHPYVSQDPLQDPCPRIHVSASICISGSSARSMSPDPYIRPCRRIHVSASSNLKILCKIHVSDSCLSIHVSASLYLRILCKIHVSGSMSQHPYVSQETLQDPCLRFMSQHP